MRLAAALFLIAAWALPAHAATTSTAAIDAIRIEMMVERIAKLDTQVTQGVMVPRSRRSLEAAMLEFDGQLRAAHAQAPPGELRETYALLTLLWTQFRAWHASAGDPVPKLRERTDELAWTAAKASRIVQENARGNSNAQAVRAANAAVLAQRVAKIHLWMVRDLRDESLARELRASDENLRRLITALRATPAPSPEIDAEIANAEGQARFLDDAVRDLATPASRARAMEFAAKAGDNITESMERAARLYAATPP